MIFLGALTPSHSYLISLWNVELVTQPVNFCCKPCLQGVRVVSNAGGVDPEACRAALLKTAAAEGFDLDVAVVTGDDLLARKGDFVDAKSMHTGKPVSMKGLTSMNAYFG